MAGKRTLSRELITTTALGVVARDGLAALSMRRLAQELDVWPMSVYRHFRDKEDLLDAVAAAGADDVALPAGKQLSAFAAEARALLERQPSDLRRRALTSAGLLRLGDAAVEALTEAGVPSAEAAIAWRTVLAYVVGSIEIDGEADAFEEGLERVLRGTIRG
jgi:TetR/AcrR family transcriptional regulator, tetracycline repressor protein